MKSVFYSEVLRLHEHVGLSYEGSARDLDFAISVDGKFSVRLTECPTDYLVMSSVLSEVRADLALSLMRLNLVDEVASQYVFAVTSAGERLVIWRRMSEEDLKHHSLRDVFDEFADKCDAVLVGLNAPCC
ncbi:CesT family type III secretion system chaperone [Pseudomonas entomophila]|uniref:CesT family type III secretion system chaperone n=1 Tax=Pseudomonas entomophila TaxID=312306 RepID=UPI00240752F4|nr:CesT family type III secretion system chaperone [Pseudomonas entomophila]MDF9618766.1 CesT family type III secretion system chaperone [Pseudomonas entomophila]